MTELLRLMAGLRPWALAEVVDRVVGGVGAVTVHPPLTIMRCVWCGLERSREATSDDGTPPPGWVLPPEGADHDGWCCRKCESEDSSRPRRP